MSITIPIEGSKDLIKKVLGDSYTFVKIKKVVVENSTDGEHCRVSMVTDEGKNIEGSGTGLVDSFFYALKAYFLEEFPSLEGIDLRKFECKAISTSVYSEVSAYAEIKNSHGNIIYFEGDSKSLVSSITKVCSSIAEYFINSDRAYRTLFTALEDAKARNRMDLIDRYTAELSIIVKSTGYNK